MFLTRVDGHAVWVNSRAMEIARIDEKLLDVPGGRILRYCAGKPTGVFIDNAMDAILSVMPPPSVRERTEALRRAVRTCIESGLTEVHDMGVDSEGVAIYRSLIESGEFPFRVYAVRKYARQAKDEKNSSCTTARLMPTATSTSAMR